MIHLFKRMFTWITVVILERIHAKNHDPENSFSGIIGTLKGLKPKKKKKKHKNRKSTHTNLHIHIRIYIHTHICICIYMDTYT